MPELWWGFGKDYPKVRFNGIAYARSISPNNIEHTIKCGSKAFTTEKGEQRTIHTAGNLKVVTARDEKIVITAIYGH